MKHCDISERIRLLQGFKHIDTVSRRWSEGDRSVILMMVVQGGWRLTMTDMRRVVHLRTLGDDWAA